LICIAKPFDPFRKTIQSLITQLGS